MTKSDAIRSVLRSARWPLSIDELLPRVERRLKTLVGRAKLYGLLAVMQTNFEIEITGRGAERLYALRQEGAAA